MDLTHRLKNSSLILYIIALAALSGCITPGGITASNVPIQEKKYEVIGPSDGKSNYSWALFGVWSFGKPDIAVAVQNAVNKKQGDAMINVQWYQQTYYFVFFSLHRVYVIGDVIKFTDGKEENKSDESGKNNAQSQQQPRKTQEKEKQLQPKQQRGDK